MVTVPGVGYGVLPESRVTVPSAFTLSDIQKLVDNTLHMQF
jgi:hypothetical protein